MSDQIAVEFLEFRVMLGESHEFSCIDRREIGWM